MTRHITPAEDMRLDAAEHARRPAPDVARANAETTARIAARMRNSHYARIVDVREGSTCPECRYPMRKGKCKCTGFYFCYNQPKQDAT
jgi:hypothetical protein